jgi:hypothetical protein
MARFEHRTGDPHDGRSLTASVCRAGHDVVIVVSGGSRPHVGSVVLAQPHPAPCDRQGGSPTLSVLSISPHRDEPIARPIAESVCRASGRTTVVTAGVHEDDIDRDGIQSYLRLADRMAAELADRLRSNAEGGRR